MKKIIIAIDGHSSTGKSTVAKMLARKLNYIYVDSGAMYRAITLYAIRNRLIEKGKVNTEKLISTLDSLDIDFTHNPLTGLTEILLNRENVEGLIRDIQVSEYVSQVAKIHQVRTKLVAIQRRIGARKGVVMDGRDIGSVVFPDAELKIFLTASLEERAKRRHQEYLSEEKQVPYEKVLSNVEERDLIDTTRKDSPLIQAEDAVCINNTHTSAEDTFQTILQLAKDRIAGRN